MDAGRRTGPQPPPRAPRSQGPRTTLRVPGESAAVADGLALELGISRDDALLRLATRGARLRERNRTPQDGAHGAERPSSRSSMGTSLRRRRHVTQFSPLAPLRTARAAEQRCTCL